MLLDIGLVQSHKDKSLDTRTCSVMVLLDAVNSSKGTLHNEADMLARLGAVKYELELPDLCSSSSFCSLWFKCGSTTQLWQGVGQERWKVLGLEPSASQGAVPEKTEI